MYIVPEKIKRVILVPGIYSNSSDSCTQPKAYRNRIVSNWIRTFHDRLKDRSVWNDWIRYGYGAATVRERYGNGCWQESEELLWSMGIFVIKLGTFCIFAGKVDRLKSLTGEIWTSQPSRVVFYEQF